MGRHISEIYTDEVHDHLRPLFGNWFPPQPVALGDFGKLDRNIFTRLGNVSQFNIGFNERSDKRKDQQFFASEGSSEVKFNGAGTGPTGAVNVKANVEVNFSSKDSVFFNAAECVYSMIADKVTLGGAIMKLYREGKWERAWAVVTDMVAAGATTIAVSGSSSSGIVFEATGNVPNINLADASIGLSVKSSRNVGYQLVAQQGLTPLIALSKIKSMFLGLGTGGFQPLSTKMFSPSVIGTLQDSPIVQTEESEEELFFGQVIE